MKILAFAGSLRQGSWNKKLLNLAAADLREMGHEVEIYDLITLPFINEDTETPEGPPPAVADFRAKVEQAKALLIATPENNHSIPAVTKNAVDWLSRPPVNLLSERHVAIIGATIGGFGTVNAQRELRWVLAKLEAFVVPSPWVMIKNSPKAFDENGNLIEEGPKRILKKLMKRFVDLVERDIG
jgi:chromate reductase